MLHAGLDLTDLGRDYDLRDAVRVYLPCHQPYCGCMTFFAVHINSVKGLNTVFVSKAHANLICTITSSSSFQPSRTAVEYAFQNDSGNYQARFPEANEGSIQVTTVPDAWLTVGARST